MTAAHRARREDALYLGPAVLGAIHRPESERALHGLLTREQDIPHRTTIAEALCRGFTTDALDDVLGIVLSGLWNEQTVQLDRLLLIAAEAARFDRPALGTVRECSRALERVIFESESRTPSQPRRSPWN